MSTYDINYEDERFKKVESEKEAALTEHEKTYDDMISQSDKHYQDQIDATNDWEKKQTEIQNQQTDFAIQQIEQQKADAQKDYTKEQSGAYVDWQTESKQHGVRAEQIADRGMQNTGYSESMQVSMYNTYQNRVSTALESFNRAVTDYNNSITQARLQNNSVLAEIAKEALQKRLELSLAGFQYKNQLLLDKADKKLQIEDSYYNRYQDVLKQINTENSLAEQIRQFNASLAEEQRQFNANFNRYSGGGGGRGGYSGYSGGSDSGYQIEKTDNKTYWTDDERKSIVASGVGPVTPYGLAVKEAEGKVNVTSDSKGNVVVNKVNHDNSAYWSNKSSGSSSGSSGSKSYASSLVSSVKTAADWLKNKLK